MTQARTITRRRAFGLVSAGACALASSLKATPFDKAKQAKPEPSRGKFLWGAATAGHQVEGNLLNDDCWLLENLPDSMFKEPSRDACDHYHLFEADIAMLASLGLNTYRFSVEWSRVEPVRGAFSQAELGHYRRVLEACHRHNVTPVVTYSHSAVPAWFATLGGWESPESPALFARYCTVVTKSLGDLIEYASTLNEPNLPNLFQWITIPQLGTVSDLVRGQLAKARTQLNQPHFSTYFAGDPERMTANMLSAHAEGRKSIKAERDSIRVGITLALMDDQDPPTAMHVESGVLEKRRLVYAPWFDIAKKDDFIGIQNYGRNYVGKLDLSPPPGVELTQTGMEFYPEGLEHAIRLAAQETGVPVFVTEHGIATDDDARRVEFIHRGVAGLQRCRKDGVDVCGYIHWSLLDNFEWTFGYAQKFGLVAVDRSTQKRTPKPSAYLLGNFAKQPVL